MSLPIGLSSYVPVRNGDRLDYPWRLAVESLLPVSEEVIVSVGRTDFEEVMGDDGTLDAALAWAVNEPKLRVIKDRWVDDVNDPTMLRRWLNRIRSECRFRSQLTLDADEVLDPRAYDFVREATAKNVSAWAWRINMWRTPHLEAPHGTVCGEYVARIGPTDYVMPSDGPEVPEVLIRQEAIRDSRFIIFHLGFLRHTEAFYAKSKVMQVHLARCYDPRLREAERTGIKWVDLCPFIDGNTGLEIPLRVHGQPIPELCKPWLMARGHEPQ